MWEFCKIYLYSIKASTHSPNTRVQNVDRDVPGYLILQGLWQSFSLFLITISTGTLRTQNSGTIVGNQHWLCYCIGQEGHEALTLHHVPCRYPQIVLLRQATSAKWTHVVSTSAIRHCNLCRRYSNVKQRKGIKAPKARTTQNSLYFTVPCDSRPDCLQV